MPNTSSQPVFPLWILMVVLACLFLPAGLFEFKHPFVALLFLAASALMLFAARRDAIRCGDTTPLKDTAISEMPRK